MAVSKLVLIGSGIGVTVATAGGVALYLTSGETLKEHTSKVLPSNRQFISLVSGADTHLEKKYLLATQDKKPTKDGKAVEKIVDWCKETENIKFSSESDPTYVLFSKWCFVNTNTLLSEAESKGKIYISNKDGSDATWKTAWDNYNTNKDKENLKITDTDLQHLNTTNKDEGAVDLHKWCTNNGTKKIYETEGEASYSKYERWCFK